MTKLDYNAIFTNLDKVTGLPLKLKGYRWYGACYMDGSPHSRWDKTTARMTRDGDIQILEQGYKAVTLWNWMLEFGGCLDNSGVFRRLNSEDNIVLDAIPRLNTKSGLFVTKMASDRALKYDELFRWMCTLFSVDEVENAFNIFGVTSTLAWNRQYATTFWYMDSERRICHDKQVLYGFNGKRDKSFGGGRLNKTADGYSNRCYFGDNLFGNIDDHNVYIVESEKTALLFWLKYKRPVVACGGLNSLRDIKPNHILLPDVDGYDDWSQKGKCVKWWEHYSTSVGEKDDIGDLIVKDLELNKLLLSL